MRFDIAGFVSLGWTFSLVLSMSPISNTDERMCPSVLSGAIYSLFFP